MGTRPSVLMLSQDVHPIPPAKGAAVEQWIDQVAHCLQHYEVLIVSPADPSLPLSEFNDGVSYRRIKISATYTRLFKKLTRLDPWPYIQRVIYRARDIHPQVIHLHNAPKYVYDLRKAFPDAVLILHMHNEKQLDPHLPIDCLAACSDYVREYYRDYGLISPHFVTIPNGVDISRFRPVWERREERDLVRQKLGLDDRKVILFVGRISPEKGPDLVSRAFAHLDPKYYQLVLAGEWPKGDPERDGRASFARELKQMLDGLPVTILGALNPKDMPNIYLAGDVLVIPSRFEEPFSMAAIEAMACGIPVLALRRGGMPEYMRDQENAVLLGPDVDPESLAESIELVFSRPEHMDFIARNARAMVEERFTWQQVAALTEKMFDDLRSSK